MSALTVVVAPGEVNCDAVLAALTDLSAAQLLTEFAWVVHPGTQAPVQAVTVVHDGAARDMPLAELATRRIDILRVVSLVPALPGSRPLPVSLDVQVAEALMNATRPQRMVRIRCLLSRSNGLSGDRQGLIAEGWHNVLVAPEESRGPGRGVVATGTSPSPAQLGRQAAPVLAGIGGLWRDVAHAPLDAEQPRPGQVLRLVRSYYRKLDTGTAESELRGRLLGLDGALPLTNDQHQRNRIVYYDDPGLAARQMADALWQKHPGVLRGPRQPYATESVDEIKAWAAIKMFFGFLWASIKNAPGAWYRKIAGEVSGMVAIRTQQALFGDQRPSEYHVVAGGQRAGGGLAGWSDIGEASERLRGYMAGPEPAQQADRDLTVVWQDYAWAAMTLADGGSRISSLPPIKVGTGFGMARNADQVIPGPHRRFTVTPEIAAAVGISEVDATDILGTQDLAGRLLAEQRDIDRGLKAGTVASELDNWRRQQGNDFGYAVGARVAKAFGDCYSEARTLLDRIANARIPETSDTGRYGLARWIQLTVVLLLALVGVMVWLAVDAYVEWWVSLVVVVISILLALLLLGYAFIKTQRRLFSLLHARKSTISTLEVDRQNLLTALDDLQRLSQAYGQFLSWSRALGSFLAAPLGPDTERTESELQIAWGLPMSAAVGRAVPQGADVDHVLGHLGRELFQVNWLSEPWERFVAGAVGAQGWQGQAPAGSESSPLWRERGAGTGSTLDRWSTAAYQGAVHSTGLQLMWNKTLGLLDGPMAALSGNLAGAVQLPNGAQESVEEFWSGLDDPTCGGGVFDATLFTEGAMTAGVTRVSEDRRDEWRAGIGAVRVLTQFSEALTLDHLLFEGAVRTDAEWHQAPLSEPGIASPQAADPPLAEDPFEAPDMGKGFGF